MKRSSRHTLRTFPQWMDERRFLLLLVSSPLFGVCSSIPPFLPLILLLDGHSSHYCPETIKIAAERKVILFALPPHTTHTTQSLDRGCFVPLKVAWRQACHGFVVKNPGRVVTRSEFCQLFSKSCRKAKTMLNIISSFKVTGVCPFDQ